MLTVLILSAVLAVSPINTDNLYPKDVFYELTIQANQKTDNSFSSDQILLLAKINRREPRFFRPGTALKVPREFKDFNWTPLPKDRLDLKDSSKVIVVSLSLQFLGAYEHGRLVFWSPISSGNHKIKMGKQTPKGSFKVAYKCPMARSRIFRASMPYAINFYRNFFIHAGVLPGYPISHGCVRMFYEEARKLYKWTEVSTSVIIED